MPHLHHSNPYLITKSVQIPPHVPSIHIPEGLTAQKFTDDRSNRRGRWRQDRRWRDVNSKGILICYWYKSGLRIMVGKVLSCDWFLVRQGLHIKKRLSSAQLPDLIAPGIRLVTVHNGCRHVCHLWGIAWPGDTNLLLLINPCLILRLPRPLSHRLRELQRLLSRKGIQVWLRQRLHPCTRFALC